jgi:FKBP-type peptidyl-prolyl cis-trans isomerase FkpA
MTRVLGYLICGLLLACHGDPGSGETTGDDNLKTDEQKTLYALGLMLGRNLGSFHLKPDQLEIVESGIYDQTQGKAPKVDLQAYAAKVSDLARVGQGADARAEKDKGRQYALRVAKDKDAQTLPSGLVYIPLKEGRGDSPRSTDTVKVQYEGTLVDGSVFDSSFARKEPAELSMDQMLPCWSEALQKMKAGGKAKLICPSSLAYGEIARQMIPAGSTLIFEIELLEIRPREVTARPTDETRIGSRDAQPSATRR